MSALPVVVVFDKAMFSLLTDLIDEEKDRITKDVFSNALTVQQLDANTGRLDGLVKLLRALNEGAMTTLAMKRDLDGEVG